MTTPWRQWRFDTARGWFFKAEQQAVKKNKVPRSLWVAMLVLIAIACAMFAEFVALVFGMELLH